MHRVRYYSQLIEPSYFKGLRGWWIRVLNRIRFWIETRNAKHVLKYLSKEDGYPKQKIHELMKEFRRDLVEERQLLSKPEVVTMPGLDEPPVGKAPQRKVGSRHATEQMLERMLAGPRSKRYAKGLSGHHFGDPDGDFEDVQPNSETQPTVEVSYGRSEVKAK